MVVCKSLDQKKKRLYLLLFLFFVILILNIFFQNIIEFKSICVFTNYVKPIGKIFNIIPYFFNKKYCCKKKNNKIYKITTNKTSNKNNLKDYIILILIIIINYLNNIIYMIDDKGLDVFSYNRIALALFFLSCL